MNINVENAGMEEKLDTGIVGNMAVVEANEIRDFH